MVSGQGGGRRGLVLVNPDWLLETQAADDFSNGLAVWSVFKGFGSASGWWRDRVPGARLMDHPTKPGAKVLHLRKPDDRAADGAVWNFPSGTRGTLTLRLKLNEGFAGAGISLLERFLDPTDDRVSSQAAFHLPIDAHGHLGRNERLTFDQWHTLEFVWDVDTQRCRVQIDGKRATSLRFMAAPLNGLSYLHLRSQATEIDPAGFLIESVQIVIGGE